MVGGIGRALGAFAAVGAMCVLAGAFAPAAAGEGRIILAAAGAEDSFGAKPLTRNELVEERAKGADHPALTGGPADYAVILFDESAKRPNPASGPSSSSYSSRGPTSASFTIVIQSH